MAKRMSDLTTEEMNVAFDAVNDKIEALIENFVPRMFKRRALDEVHSAQGRKMLLEAIDLAFDAVEEHQKKKGTAT